MISFGPELAIDLSALDAAAATANPAAAGAAPFDAAQTDLFNAMLGQMMEQAGNALEPGLDGDDARPEDEGDASLEIDPTQLVNPVSVDAVTPVAPPAATMVWSISAVPADMNAAIAIETTTPAALPAAVETTAGMWSPPIEVPPSIDAPPSLDLPVGPDVPEMPLEASAAPAPASTPAPTPGPAHVSVRQQATEIKADVPSADLPVALPPATTASSTSTASTPSANTQARAEFAPAIAEAIAKSDVTVRSSKQEKAPVEPKIDPAGLRPLPFVAVERAYAGNEQGSSKPFDSPREQSSLPGAPPSAQTPAPGATTPAFVVPVDGRSLINTPLVSTPSTVDIPASMARDVDTHVPAQIVQSIRLQASTGGGEAIIRLNPHYLGEVVVAVKVEQGNVIAALQAETPAVRQWVERNESVLRQALAEQGLQLDKLTVAEKASETEREDAREQARDEAREEQSQQQPRRRRPQSDEATFEVTV